MSQTEKKPDSWSRWGAAQQFASDNIAVIISLLTFMLVAMAGISGAYLQGRQDARIEELLRDMETAEDDIAVLDIRSGKNEAKIDEHLREDDGR